jgi:hypothetical protein
MKRSYLKRNKFNAKSMVYNGRRYDSKLEASYAMELDWRKKAGEIIEISPQHKISLDINGAHIANYYIDFKIILCDGTEEYHEVKGFETDLWRLKWKLTKAIYPEYKLVLIK